MNDNWRVGVTIECRGQAQQIVTLMKWAGISVSHSRRTTLVVSSISLLVMGSIVASAEAASLTTKDTVSLTCSADLRVMNFTANSTWQEIKVNATGINFYRDCAVNVRFASNSTSFVGQLAVLVKVYKLQLFPVGSHCSFRESTLEIQSLAMPINGYDICPDDIVDDLYIWVSIPIRLYLLVSYWATTRPSFSAAFGVVQSVNVCLQSSVNNEQLIVDDEVYAFAPDVKFAKLLPFHTFCHSTVQLTIAAASYLSTLNLTVLAAPKNRSCWSLWLNGSLVSYSLTRSFAPSSNVSLLYKLASGCNTMNKGTGFTIKLFAAPTLTVTMTKTAPATSVNASAGTDLVGDFSSWISAIPGISESLPGGTDLTDTSGMPMAVGSAVAALVVIAVMLVVAVLAIHRRRVFRHRSFFYDSRDPTMASTSDLTNTATTGYVNQDQLENQLDHNVQLSAHVQSPTVTDLSTSYAAAQEIRAGDPDIQMTENVLYISNVSS